MERSARIAWQTAIWCAEMAGLRLDLAFPKLQWFVAKANFDASQPAIASGCGRGAGGADTVGLAAVSSDRSLRHEARRDCGDVIADWLSRGGGELEWGEYPFTFPEDFEVEDAAEWRRINNARLDRLSP